MALAPIASMRAVSTASNTSAAAGSTGRIRAWAPASWWDRRSAIWSASPRMRAASRLFRSRGGWGRVARLPTSDGGSAANTTSRSGVSARLRVAWAIARLNGSVGLSGLSAMPGLDSAPAGPDEGALSVILGRSAEGAQTGEPGKAALDERVAPLHSRARWVLGSSLGSARG